MKLCDHGLQYESNATTININQISTTDKCRGCTYQKNNGVITLPQELDNQGISLSSGKEIHFLGQSCAQKQILFTPMPA